MKIHTSSHFFYSYIGVVFGVTKGLDSIENADIFCTQPFNIQFVGEGI